MKTVTGMGGVGGARELAEMLQKLGRNGDTMLAHITPEEAQMLIDMGGSGTINPATGLPEFYDADIQGGENFYGEPIQPDYNYDVEAQAGGFYGNTPEATFYPYTQTTYRTVDQAGNALPGRGEPIAGYYAPGGGFEALQAEQGNLDIGFGPGRFAPQYTPADVQGMPPDQFQRMMAPMDQGFLRETAQGVEDTAAKVKELAREYPTVARLLSTGATTLPALINAIRARRAAERSAAELRQLGAPLRAEGEALRTQALAGQLTPQQAAAQEAARARLRQTAATRGVTTGTQATMIENQLARSRSEQSQTNLNNAIKMLNLANIYDEGAIKAKLASDAEIENTLANIFQNIGRDLTGQQQQKDEGQQQRQQPALSRLPELTRRPEVK